MAATLTTVSPQSVADAKAWNQKERQFLEQHLKIRIRDDGRIDRPTPNLQTLYRRGTK